MAFPNIRRSDFSHSLVHLTKERGEYVQDDKTLEQKLERVVPGFGVFKEILSDGVIRSSLGFVKGTRSPCRVSVGNPTPTATPTADDAAMGVMAMRIMRKIGLRRRQSVKTGHGHMLEPARSAAPCEDHRSGRAARR